MLRAFWSNNRDVLPQVTLAQQQTVPGCAWAAPFVAVITCLGGFDLATVFVSERRVDAAIRLRCNRRRKNQTREQTEKYLHPSIKIAFTLATGVINVDHLQLRVEVQRGGTLFPIADACAFG